MAHNLRSISMVSPQACGLWLVILYIVDILAASKEVTFVIASGSQL